jgi:hypothetical protein
MKIVPVVILLLTFCSCTSRYEQFDKYFSENTEDTIHIYCVDNYDIPASVKPIIDTTISGREIDIDLIRFFKLDSAYDKLFKPPDANYYAWKKFFGVYKYKIADGYTGYVVRVSHPKVNPRESLVEYIYNTKENNFDTTVFLSYLWRALSAENDINSWILDINKDGSKDLLTKSSFFDYGLMDDLYSTNNKLDNKSIIKSCRYDTAWINLWAQNKYESKPIRYGDIANNFNFKMLDYYKGYRHCYWFE